jgi:hypothetical protein
MSQFLVLVKLSQERLARHRGRLDAALAEMLAPYQSNNLEECDPEYLVFSDREDQWRAEYETGTSERIQMPDGRLLLPFDDEFRIAGAIGYGTGTHHVPEHLESAQVPFRELYPPFEEFVADWHGLEQRAPQTGRYGYWENPNAKWDWYQIGGNWSGGFRVKEMAASARRGGKGWINADQPDQPHKADAARVEDIDFEGMDLEVGVRIDEWWARWERGEVETGNPFVGVQHDLLQMGLRRLENETELRAAIQRSREEPVELPEPVWHTEPFTKDDLHTRYRWYFEFQTFAVVDEDGWHEQGEILGFGLSGETAEDRAAWGRSYAERFLRHEAPETTLVIVDCHV